MNTRTKAYCPACRKEMDQILQFIWLCQNKQYPHLWHGHYLTMLSGITDEVAIRLAEEVVSLTEQIVLMGQKESGEE